VNAQSRVISDAAPNDNQVGIQAASGGAYGFGNITRFHYSFYVYARALLNFRNLLAGVCKETPAPFVRIVALPRRVQPGNDVQQSQLGLEF
jgi:hypothetical protein